MFAFSRKDFLRGIIRYAVGAAAGAAAVDAGGRISRNAEASTTAWPWPYVRLDPEDARRLAHDCFYDLGCGYAGFAGIVKALQAKVGDPFTSIPPQMMSYGGGGIKGWGTICGALNGASAAISLVLDARASGPVIDELMGWYSSSLLPSDASNRLAEKGAFKAAKSAEALPQNRSGSPLCHVSVSKWCETAGYSVEAPERYERCARLSGDVAAQAVTLLNDQILGRFTAAYSMPKSTSECLACHGPKGEEKNVASKLDCVQCHQDPHKP